jgi:hypothetical protein
MENKSGKALTDLAVKFEHDSSLKLGPFTRSANAVSRQEWKQVPPGDTVNAIWNMRLLSAAQVTVNGETREVPMPLGKK